MNYVQRLTQTIERDDERDVGLRGTLRAGNHVDTVASQRIEQSTCYTRCVFHILSNDSHRSQVVHYDNIVDLALRNLFGKFACQLLDSLSRIRFVDTNRGGVFRCGLCYEVYADTRQRQCAEDTMIDADNTNHTKTLNCQQTRIIDRRNTLDATLISAVFVRNQCSCRLGVERIANTDRNILVIDRENRRRIDNLCSEVTQLGSLGKCQMINDVGRINHARIGRHKSIDIGPNLQQICIESRCYDSGRIVRTATTEVGHVATIAIRRDESAHNGALGQCGKFLADTLVRLLEIDNVFVVVVRSANDRARVFQFSPIDHRRNNGRR